ncbi:MAG: ABC transporter ATP-binding protein [Firmicutes bacterium]|nr:ABC transporter ATP-binding protein [Bacillota bacterium]
MSKKKKIKEPEGTQAFIKFDDVIKTYKMASGPVHALKGLNFEINEGEFVVIVGPSGAGKTTLLNLLGGMDRATSGTMMVDGQDVAKFNEPKMVKYRRDMVGFVFQFYNLMPNLTALENIELATEIRKESLKPLEVLEQVGLTDRKNNFPSQLSGGEQQRVSIARSVAKNSKIILCDEPTGALDYETGKKILKLLHDICREHNRTVVLVTHNSALKDMADKVITIKNGLAEEVILNPSPKPIEDIEW